MTKLQRNDPTKARQYFADKLAFTTGPMEVAWSMKEGDDLAMIDVREERDFKEGHVPGAVNLPREKWNTCEGLRRDALNVIYCYTPLCHLAAEAAMEFAGKGYPVMEMEGGFEGWKESDQEIERGERSVQGARRETETVPF